MLNVVNTKFMAFEMFLTSSSELILTVWKFYALNIVNIDILPLFLEDNNNINSVIKWSTSIYTHRKLIILQLSLENKKQ